MLSADSPLTDPSQDALGYSQFAKQLATAIMRMAPVDGLVISLNGPWGSGKSTCINFVASHLDQVNDEQRPLVVRFNPWCFSDRDDLTRLLIGQLLSHLGTRDYRKIKNLLADLGELVSKMQFPGAQAGEFAANRLRDQANLPELRANINKELLAKKRKILVLIDDVDRLAPDEICDLFRTIKAVAGFPNVIYLLAFDTKMVVEALEQGFVANGVEFLEKIVQLPCHLPPPDGLALQQLLFGRLEGLLASTPAGLFDSARWTNTYLDGLERFFRTPRDVVRVTNTLWASYPSLVGEVDPVDFIAIEALRVFSPQLYHTVRDGKRFLTHPDTPFDALSADSLRGIYEGWLASVDDVDRDPCKRVLSRLFPRFAEAYGGPAYGPEFEATWRRELRICSPDMFIRYFAFAVAADDISSADMNALLEKSADQRAFSLALVEYSTQVRRDGTTRARTALQRLEDYTENGIALANIPCVVCALLDVGDRLLNERDEGRGMLDFGNDVRLIRLLDQLLSRLNAAERATVLSRAIGLGESLYLCSQIVGVIDGQHGRLSPTLTRPEADRIVDEEQLEALHGLVLDKIRTAAREGTLLDTPHLSAILFRWRVWSHDDGEVKSWVQMAVTQDAGLVALLRGFARASRVMSSGDMVPQRHLQWDPESLGAYVDVDEVVSRAYALVRQGGLPPEQDEVVSSFLRWHWQASETGR